MVFLLVSYGAPSESSEVVPFLGRLFAGKGVSPAHIAKAAEKYYEFARRNGNFSPLNEQCRELRDGIELEFLRVGFPSRVYQGNLYGQPFIEDTIKQMKDDGVKSAKCFVTSAFDSTAGNRKYSVAIAGACQRAGGEGLRIERLLLPFDHPLFIGAQAARLVGEFGGRENIDRDFGETLVLFSAHSIPKSDPCADNYLQQLNYACREVMLCCELMCAGLREVKWELVFQSQPINTNKGGGQVDQWLKPSINERVAEIIREANGAGTERKKNIIVSPIGFFCESMETVNDLDFVLGDMCEGAAVNFARVLTVGTMPEIYEMIVKMALGG
ncbi:MAG: ferrochelatase [Planctomycetaceae bacterium]|nr:ferrochelatase [Planctomycetaceae bacterium]